MVKPKHENKAAGRIIFFIILFIIIVGFFIFPYIDSDPKKETVTKVIEHEALQ